MINLFIHTLLDCQTHGWILDIYRGEERCIAVDTAEYVVNPDTLTVTACTELFGGNASQITLPYNETELWDYVVKHLAE